MRAIISALNGPLSSKRSVGEGLTYGKSEAGVFGIGTGEAALRSAPAYSIESAYGLNEFLGFGGRDGREVASEERRAASNSPDERSLLV